MPNLTLVEFISLYDKEGSIVLLEGKREVSLDDTEKLTSLGKLIVSLTTKIIFRSGNAPGADHFFSVGVASVDKKRLEVIIPYTGHRKDKVQAGYSFSLDDRPEPSILGISLITGSPSNSAGNSGMKTFFPL